MTLTDDADQVEQIRGRAVALRSAIADLTDRPVRVVCVTKGHPVEAAAAAIEAGFVELGENYAQELAAKVPELSPEVRWHFIGRLQSNKVRSIAGAVSVWQSIDRVSIAEEVARRAPGARVMVQLDLAGVEGRGGCVPDDLAPLVGRCRSLELNVVGLMGVGPHGDPELSRRGFRRLVEMADDLGLEERSIGMSGDLRIAVEEGSTMVRIGTALMGERSASAHGRRSAPGRN